MKRILFTVIAATAIMCLPCAGAALNGHGTAAETICDTTQTEKSEYDRLVEERAEADSKECQRVSRGAFFNKETILREGVSIVPHEGGPVIIYEENGKYGVAINRSDALVMYRPQFENVYNEDFYYSGCMVLLKKNGKWGAMNLDDTPGRKLTITVPFIYDRLTPFRNGKSTATFNGETFTIDKFGKRLD